MSTTSRTRHAHNIAEVVRHGRPVGGTPLDEYILTSWNRCLSSYGIDPVERHEAVVLESLRVRERKQSLDRLIEIAGTEMQQLYESVAGSGCAIILTDAEGVILHNVCDPVYQTDFRNAGLWLGAHWGEKYEGTNGIGTCIVERRPVTVHRDEHFRSANVGLTCSAAPIRDPAGKVLAILDSSACDNADSRNGQAHVRALVTTSAVLIENHIFLFEYRDQRILRFHSRAEYVGLPSEGLLAIDGDGRVLAANATAASALVEPSTHRLAGRFLGEIFDEASTSTILRTGAGLGTLLVVRERDTGRRYFATVMTQRPSLSVTTRTTLGARNRPQLALEDVAGLDPQMQYNVRCAERVMNKGISIIISGETGTGKEVFARAIHNASERAVKPFVAINCSAIPESLIESELFGYKHGAFTGARREGMKGKVLQSSGGTLFLDEIGDMPLPLQTRLLRCLEEGEVVPLGGEKSVPVALNVISATHRNLEELVARGEFREDLYYRLAGITLDIVSLRERDDKEALIREIVDMEKDTDGPVRIDDEALNALLCYPWPGNIRQLRNVIQTALALSDDHVIRLVDLPDHIANPSTRSATAAPAGAVAPVPQTGATTDQSPTGVAHRANPLDAAEKNAIQTALRANDWNISNTAAALDMSRNTLYRKLKKHGLSTARSR